MPIGPMVWKKIAPDMMPMASKAPHTRVQGSTTRIEARISMLATVSRKGFS